MFGRQKKADPKFGNFRVVCKPPFGGKVEERLHLNVKPLVWGGHLHFYETDDVEMAGYAPGEWFSYYRE